MKQAFTTQEEAAIILAPARYMYAVSTYACASTAWASAEKNRHWSEEYVGELAGEANGCGLPSASALEIGVGSGQWGCWCAGVRPARSALGSPWPATEIGSRGLGL
mmetsp:Transcript_53346/g.152190  ORF Transcript_53346/g.152190 Transcript_53346/m.152190 type:complete len:106 (+) Transcript_53346:32-349(+)